MTAEVRLHIRQQRDLVARARMDERHVEFCAECGDPYDRTGRVSVDVCRPCRYGHSVSTERRVQP